MYSGEKESVCSVPLTEAASKMTVEEAIKIHDNFIRGFDLASASMKDLHTLEDSCDALSKLAQRLRNVICAAGIIKEQQEEPKNTLEYLKKEKKYMEERIKELQPTPKKRKKPAPKTEVTDAKK